MRVTGRLDFRGGGGQSEVVAQNGTYVGSSPPLGGREHIVAMETLRECTGNNSRPPKTGTWPAARLHAFIATWKTTRFVCFFLVDRKAFRLLWKPKERLYTRYGSSSARPPNGGRWPTEEK